MAQDNSKKVVLTDERRGEIALALVKHKLRQSGVKISPDYKREVCQWAKDIGIPEDEALVFYEELVRSLVDDAFASGGSSRVRVTRSTIRP